LSSADVQVVKGAAKAGVQQIIISDTNIVFIQELLVAHGLQVRLLLSC
jgi:hypothetical protein